MEFKFLLNKNSPGSELQIRKGQGQGGEERKEEERKEEERKKEGVKQLEEGFVGHLLLCL